MLQETAEKRCVLAKVNTAAVLGIEALPVEVEVDLSPGLPAFTIVGLPDGAVRESRERVKAAIKNSGYSFPTQRITINLAPADLKKDGTGFDLPIAIGILLAQGLLPSEPFADWILVGELSLDGALKAARGLLPMAFLAREKGWSGLVAPEANASEAAVIKEVSTYAATSLAQVVEHFSGRQSLPLARPIPSAPPDIEEDFADILGQASAKRALEVAAAGGHNLLMIGPPGSGKTMLSRRLPGILPPLSREESLETSRIYSVAGLLKDGALIERRPFRSPHHTVSDAGLIGGGTVPRPGELSLAHNGVLYLDELPEFHRHVLEALRQPLEEGRVTISRASISITYPARVQLLASMNPCPCGHLGDRLHACTCGPREIARYRSRISGPLLDRIDIHIEVPALPVEELSNWSRGESSEVIRERVMEARERQNSRLKEVGLWLNCQMGPRELAKFAKLRGKARELLDKAARRLGFSARAYHRVIKISRTIADLAGSEEIDAAHIAEAIQYRSLDRRISGLSS
ncbi:magnesium chelatase family protein [Thermosulfuriphilus ammonigenes]|uniref:YifB family Mg chelatase-like AAA ATPase n=1 Tax=Thermosulfuriphilus ammonigenes TaxID=1936021 RepID=UPI001838146C|nr:YifB family Mg chelatase-like AAA ATPase [Thermosulfuriphilus ammonigenes]MBA2848434.1 magnesium chelatase family protein [Thermosulfuriphilus ammonigenes]